MVGSLDFAIYPDAESVPIGLFQKALEDVHRLVKDVDYAVTHETEGRRWVIASLHSSAPTVTIRPMLDGTGTVETILAGLRVVAEEAGADLPSHFPDDALQDLKKMRRLFKGHERAQKIVFSTDEREVATIRRDIDKRVERVLRDSYAVLGSVDGMLEAINLHGNRSFTVWDRVSGVPVRCLFPKAAGWTERVKELLERRVLVTGRIHYFKSGVPRSVSEIQALDDASPVSPLYRAAFGSIPDLTGESDSVAYLRRIRE